MEQLEGRVAVITGGGSGIGRGTALALARAKAVPIVVDIDGDRARAVEEEARQLGVDAVGVACDVTRDEDVVSLRDLALERFGRADIVMNNVSVIPIGRPETLPMSEWQRAIDVNLLATIRSLQVFLPLFLKRGEGHVVNTASTAGLFAYAYERLPYTATKAAVVAVSEALALYLRPKGIGVTCLCPGPTATNIVEQIRFHDEVPLNSPGDLEVMDADTVGGMVVDAIRDNTFLLLPHGDAVHDILVRRAQDPEAFLAAQIEALTAKQDDADG
jgi:NAD(P)-dependent dehydrogenase (short-subunit alcohol dehydrogenase family)